MSTADPFATLHERIVAHLDEVDRLLVTPVRGYQALRAVVELHAPVTFWRPWADEPPACKSCRSATGEPVAYPCAEAQAIARELGVDG